MLNRPKPQPRPWPISRSLLVMFVTITSGLVVRFAPLGLPPFITKYGGSALWAVLTYWIVSTLLPGFQPGHAGLLAGVLAAGVEFFKLYHSPGLDAFRRTLPGVLLLGRFFSLWDLAAYGFAVLFAMTLDYGIRRRLAGRLA